MGYRVLVHLRHVTDFDPANPSPPESDNGDSGHDGNPDRHHFSKHRGRRCAAGVLPPPNTVEEAASPEEGAELIVPSNLAASTAAHGRGGLIQD